jgi:hypothetical protein
MGWAVVDLFLKDWQKPNSKVRLISTFNPPKFHFSFRSAGSTSLRPSFHYFLEDSAAKHPSGVRSRTGPPVWDSFPIQNCLSKCVPSGLSGQPACGRRCSTCRYCPHTERFPGRFPLRRRSPHFETRHWDLAPS